MHQSSELGADIVGIADQSSLSGHGKAIMFANVSPLQVQDPISFPASWTVLQKASWNLLPACILSETVLARFFLSFFLLRCHELGRCALTERVDGR